MSKEVDIIIIKKSDNHPTQQISMRLPLETTFQEIVNFLVDQGYLKNKHAIVRPHHNPVYAIGMERKINDCFNIIQLKFIVEEGGSNNTKMTKVQALRSQNKGYCGNCSQQNCIIM